ncbi:hypothetical protein N0V93_003593 [Gnomoniopsis smithogilvyi]|uniref:Uncharacterized protein n=1 Tax=Gnomoniopsis smithogilvyi TaxID=1191159 RepID=A0A9W9CZA1_9PEZI|nr:hypothetical protein N0V93_003593 [Gnomoniopsis smithogilvyi]
MPVPSEDLCEHYGNFMHEVQRPQAEATFWIFFVAVLFLLFAASWRFGRVVERTEGLRVDNPTRQALVYRCFYYTLVAGFVALIIAVLEVFVLLTLQFCDGEPLSSLYWSVWTVLQVGAVVAIFGITLHVRHMIRGRKNPPWALALGTPVLVVAGLGHYFQGKIRRGTKRVVSHSRSRSRHQRGRTRMKDEPLSEAPTIREDSTDSDERSTQRGNEDTPTIYGDSSDKFNAKIIGYTKEGDVIIRISPELSQELHGLKPKSSITWDEPRWKNPPTQNEKEEEAETPRIGRSRHRSSSSVTIKGKEKLSIQQIELAQRQQNSTDSAEMDARNTSLPVNPTQERLPPTRSVSPLSESIRRMTHSDESLRLARLDDWLPNLAHQTEKGDLNTGTAPRGDKEQE